MIEETNPLPPSMALTEEPSVEIPRVPKQPRIFLYSILLPVIWFSFGYVFHKIFTGKNLGMFGLVIVLYLTLIPICWHLSKYYGRQFDDFEKFKLATFFSIWSFLAEIVSLQYMIGQPGNQLKVEQVPTVILFTLVVDIAFCAMGVIFTSRRITTYFLNRRLESAA